MKRAEITEGNCYRISRSVDSIPLLKKEINEGRFIMNKGRPYVVVFNSTNDDFIWVAPLTSNEQKYRSYIKLEEEKYHNAKSYIITSCGDKNSAISLSNAFPVLPKYIKEPCIQNKQKLFVSKSVLEKSQDLLSEKINMSNKGVKAFWSDVKKIRKAFLNLEFKKFKDLSLEEQKKVVYHCYNEYLETLDTAQEYKNALHKIYASLQRRDDVFFNPYTLEKRTYKIMKMGLPLGEIKKGKPFYKRLSSREVYVISKELEKRKVQYSAVIRQDGEGQITVQRKDGNTLTRLINTNRNNISGINRKLELDSNSPEKYVQIACKMEDALMICSRFDGYDVPYNCSFFEGKTAQLTVEKKNLRELQHAMKKFDVFAKIQPMQQTASQNMQSLTL